jgi:hypothetical protein
MMISLRFDGLMEFVEEPFSPQQDFSNVLRHGSETVHERNSGVAGAQGSGRRKKISVCLWSR